MKNILHKIFRKLCLLFINSFLSTTRYFKLKRILMKFSGINIGKDTKVVGPIYIGSIAKLIVGENCWIGSGIKVYGNGVVIIGSNCDIAPDVAFITGSHEIGSIKRRAGKGLDYEIVIEDGCWIGARATIMGDVIISNSTIIGASSLVNKSIPPNVIAGGVPVKILKNL